MLTFDWDLQKDKQKMRGGKVTVNTESPSGGRRGVFIYRGKWNMSCKPSRLPEGWPKKGYTQLVGGL